MRKTKKFMVPLSDTEAAFLQITNRGEGVWRIQIQSSVDTIELPDYTEIASSAINEFSASHEGRMIAFHDEHVAGKIEIEAHDRLFFTLHDRADNALLAQGVLAQPYEAGFQCSLQTNRDWSVLGLGEKCGSLNKKGKTWEMWNTDEPEHSPDTDPLYASIPVFFHHTPGFCVGVLINSTARVVFDCAETEDNRIIISIPEENLDYCICAGRELGATQQRLTRLGGAMPMPPLWSLGFHQSRYSYYSAMQVRQLVKEFRTRRIPCDVVHLDIHYMDYFRVFTWDTLRFPDIDLFIKEMQKENIHLVTIVDPGVKIDAEYPVYAEGCAQNLFITRDNGAIYEGEVWPGPAVYPDFFNGKTQDFWVHWHRMLLGKGIAGIWNDMNEPANFHNTDDLASQGRTLPSATRARYKGHSIPFDKLHNAYATAMAEATRKAFLQYRSDKRPFILTRAASFGAQRYTALWTGDNSSWWEHLQQMIPMLLNLGFSGFSFVGSDVGGFQKNANAELYTRWMAAACLTPFFRAHSELNSKKHEPWAFGAECEAHCRTFIALRYRFLPYLYTQFYHAASSGIPIMRSLGYVFEDDTKARFIQDQYLVGADVLVAPVLTAGASARAVYLPAGFSWYAWEQNQRIAGGEHHLAPGDLADLPLYVREGSVVANEAVRMHTAEAREEMLSLHVYPDAQKNAHGTLYIDAGDGLAHQQGDYLYLEIFCTDARCRVRRQSGLGSFSWPGIRVLLHGEHRKTAVAELNPEYFQTHDEIVLEATTSL